jgi:hypothetical protein
MSSASSKSETTDSSKPTPITDINVAAGIGPRIRIGNREVHILLLSQEKQTHFDREVAELGEAYLTIALMADAPDAMDELSHQGAVSTNMGLSTQAVKVALRMLGIAITKEQREAQLNIARMCLCGQVPGMDEPQLFSREELNAGVPARSFPMFLCKVLDANNVDFTIPQEQES